MANNGTYQQRRRWGMKGAIGKWSKEPPFEERFWMRVDIRGPSECWNWKRSTAGTAGYGKVTFFKNGKKKYDSAHRVAFELKYGKIPEGKHLCHHCDNRACCNPSHLFVGTAKDNALDKVKKNRHNARYGINHHGAKLTEDQVRYIKSKKGAVRQCKLATELGVSGDMIHYIWHRGGWAHVK